MRSPVAFMVMGVLLASIAQAQTRPAHALSAGVPDKGYIEGVAQSVFSNVTSQSYGVEGGVTVWRNLQVFVEGGKTRNVATSDLGINAGAIAAYLTGSQSASVSYSVKEPVTFGAAGLRCRFSGTSQVSPYIIGGVGIAKVTKDVHFVVGGTDVTSSLTQFGVTLGTDLSGSYTKPMLVLGGGVTWTVAQRLVIDFQYRYGRISPENQAPSLAPTAAINVNNAGAGVGFRF